MEQFYMAYSLAGHGWYILQEENKYSFKKVYVQIEFQRKPLEKMKTLALLLYNCFYKQLQKLYGPIESVDLYSTS